MSSKSQYVAAKTIRVQTSGGGLEIRNEGDPVPEATGWRYIYKLIDNGYIRRVASAVKAVIEPEPEALVEHSHECSECGRRLRTAVGLKRHTTSVHKRVKG